MRREKDIWRMEWSPEMEAMMDQKMVALGIDVKAWKKVPEPKTVAETIAEMEAAMREAEGDPEYLWLIYLLAGYQPKTEGNA